MSTIEEEQTRPEQPAIERPTMHQRNDTLEVLLDIPAIVTHQEAHSQRTGKTLLSGTEATHHHQSLDEIVDTKSVTSYAVTVKDLHGKGVELPPPPRAADGDKDFECPYCYINVLRDMEEVELGEHICCKTCNPTFARILNARAQSSCFDLVGSGRNTKLATVKPGGVRNIPPRSIRQALGWKSTSIASMRTVSQRANSHQL
jgi:TusA-related sulfurtransferase